MDRHYQSLMECPCQNQKSSFKFDSALIAAILRIKIYRSVFNNLLQVRGLIFAKISPGENLSHYSIKLYLFDSVN